MLHQSVMLEESLTGLAIKPDGIYVDGTFGRGGHSRAILDRLSTNCVWSVPICRRFAIDVVSRII